jgi:hypothetical protein
LLATVVGAAAGGRGRGRVGWFVLALILSPLVGVLLAILPDLRTHEMPKEIASASASASASVSSVDDRELMRNVQRGTGWHP